VSHVDERLGELGGRLAAIETQVGRLLDRADAAPAVAPADPHSGVKTAVTFVAAVVVPILVAVLGGYFALKGAGLR